MTANGMTNIDMATKRRYTLADGGRASERGFWRLEHGCKACPKETQAWLALAFWTSGSTTETTKGHNHAERDMNSARRLVITVWYLKENLTAMNVRR